METVDHHRQFQVHLRETGPRNLGSTIDGRRGEYIYLKCNSAAIGGCPHRQWHQLDKIERAIPPRIAGEVVRQYANDRSD
jgi:hypothetical protein